VRWAFLVFAIFVVGAILAADLGLAPLVFSLVRAVPGGDKIGHFVLVGGLAFLAEFALRGRRIGVLGLRLPLGSLLIAVAATLEEFSQLLLARRSFDVLDLVFDFAGIAILGTLARRWITNAGSARR